jgi:hypothetical protein
MRQKSQSKRFVDKARELGCDESAASFDASLKKLATATVNLHKKLKRRRKRP